MKSNHLNSVVIWTTNLVKAEGKLELAPQETGGANIFHLMALLINQKCMLEAKADTALIKFNMERFRQDKLCAEMEQSHLHWKENIQQNERMERDYFFHISWPKEVFFSFTFLTMTPSESRRAETFVRSYTGPTISAPFFTECCKTKGIGG